MRQFWHNTMTSPDKTALECDQFIGSIKPPDSWKEAMKMLWIKPSEDTVTTALEALGPTSAPGEDGIPALLYHVFSDYFVPRIMLKIDSIARTGYWGERWAKGIMRTTPKEVGNLVIDKQKTITLLNPKAKWITGTIQCASKDFLVMMVPTEQKGFMLGRNMDGRLHKVMEIQSQNEQGAWVSIDFLKAYNKVGHPMIEGLLRYLGSEEHWSTMLIEFMTE